MGRFDEKRSTRHSDIRFDKQRNVRLEHDSAKGKVVRNVGSFTRGTQLVRLQYMMVWQGVKVPLIIGLSSFGVLLCLLMYLRMHEHETQLVLMRTLAAFWDWCDLNPYKTVNLTIPSGDMISIPMGAVRFNDYVETAWDIFTRCILAALIGSTVATVPLSIWFTNMAHERGIDILQERHERGAMLVDKQVLKEEIQAYNLEKLAAEVREKNPDFDPRKVATASVKQRMKYGYHSPYSIAGVPIPYDLERTHGFLMGSTGSGKTTVLLDMIEQARERNHRAVIFDLTGVFVQHFYDPERDFILNPIDERCPAWSVFSDSHNILDFTAAGAALFPTGNDGGDPFWTLAARTLFVEMCMKLNSAGLRSNAALMHHLLYADLKDVHQKMKGTLAAPLTSVEAARMAESIRSVINTQAQILRYLPEKTASNPNDFSINEWVKQDKGDGSFLFITSTHKQLTVTKPLLSLWMDTAVNALLETERNAGMKIWFLFDEVHALQRLPALESGLQTGRAYGGAFFLGIHSFEKLCETYGREGAINLAALTRNKVILSCAERETAEFASSIIGSREVREVDESYSIGAAKSRDAATITPRTDVKPLIMPDDIMNLPSLYGVIKFAEGFPAARIKFNWKRFDIIAQPYIDKKHLTDAKYVPLDEGDEEDDAEEGGREKLGQKALEAELIMPPEALALDEHEQQNVAINDNLLLQIDEPTGPVATPSAADNSATGPEVTDILSQITGSVGLGNSADREQRNSSNGRGESVGPSQATTAQRDDVATTEMRTGVSTVDPAKPHEEHHKDSPPAQARGDWQMGD